MKIRTIALALVAAPALGFAAPVLAQDPSSAAPSDGNYPTCSATVTDHCVQRAAKAPAHHSRHGRSMHHHRNSHRHHRR